jgi:6,7-dimethyl-8-ribityllumazine synthase
MLVVVFAKALKTQVQFNKKEVKKKMAKETIRIGAVVSDFNYDITMMMLERAKEHAEFLGAEITKVVKVPGVFDMALAIKKLLARKDIDGVITIGAVIEGETEHDDLVIQHAARKIADLALEFDKPVGLGISGPGMTRLQAEDRIERGKAAVEAVVKLHQRLQKI